MAFYEVAGCLDHPVKTKRVSVSLDSRGETAASYLDMEWGFRENNIQNISIRA